MAKSKKKKNGGGGRKGFTLPIAVLGGFAPLGINVWDRRGNPRAALEMATLALTGFALDGSWHSNTLKFGMIPIAAGALVHWLANRIGLNRAIARAGIPILRV